MSILAKYNNGILQVSDSKADRRTPSPLKYDPKTNTFISGELFGLEAEKVARLDWEENPNILNELDGSIALLKVGTNHCSFAIDMNGLDSFYYYNKDELFIISDDFWDVVAEIQPSIEDVNTEFIRYCLFEGGSFDGSTIIKGIFILPPNHIGIYEASSNTLQVSKYHEFKYTNTCKDVDMAVEHMDRILHETMKRIKSVCGNVKYGVGISGGLDSRIISHYAKAHCMETEGFNICVPRPHGILLARSVKNAQDIAKAFNIKCKNVSWNPKTLDRKIRLCIKYNPTFNGNSFKFEDEGLPEFEVLLTGGTGIIVGSSLPDGLENFTEKELADSIYTLFSSYGADTFGNRVKRALSYLFGIKQKTFSERESWFAKRVIGTDYSTRIYDDIKHFVESRKEDGLSNIEVFEDYLLNICGYNNRNGAFESLFGSKRSFSIYVPFLLKETLTWAPELLYNRNVLNALIRKKVTEVENIKSESFHLSPKDKRGNIAKKALGLLEFLIRGNGTAIDQYYLSKRQYKRIFIDKLNGDKADWFHRILNIENVTVTKSDIRSESVRLIARVWELSTLMDCLEKRDYLSFKSGRENIV